MSAIWNGITTGFEEALSWLHAVLEPLFGVHAWGWAIILLTIIIRVLLLPLAIKQTRSMRAMQQLQPKIKKLQEKYKVDRELMRKDPETYRLKKQKLNEEMMALYKEEGVNPASGCLPLIAQAPIFIALFSVLRSSDAALVTEPFYFFTSFISPDAQFHGLGAQTSQAGWPGWLLIVLMAGTMFWTQRQMMNKNNAEGSQAQQQKIMMYVMPVFLAFISQSIPLGVLLYWVTTNLWQGGQQYVILREVAHDAPGGGGGSSGNGAKPSSKGPKDGGGKRAGGAGNGRAKKGPKSQDGSKRPADGSSKKKSKNRDHLPRRRG